MKRDNGTRKKRADTAGKFVICSVLVLLLLDIIVAINIFSLESVPYIDKDGQAGFNTHMLFGIVLDYPITPVCLDNVSIIIISIIISGLLIWEGGPVKHSNYVNNVSSFIVLISVLVGLISVAGVGVNVLKSGSGNHNSVLMSAIIEQEYEPKSESSLYRFSSGARYGLKGELFLRGLDGYEHTDDMRSTKQNSDNMIDALEHKDDKPDTPQYRIFRLVELEAGEYHLFSYDSGKDIDHVNDVVDLGELDKKEFNTFKSLVEKVE